MADATLIVGAGAGLSASLAKRFASDGSAIVLASRTTSRLAQISDETGALVIECDASREERVVSLFEQIDAAGHNLKTVIYNAGSYARGAITELDPDVVSSLFQVNAFGAFLTAREAAKRMQRNGSGTMLFTGASAGIKGYAGSAAFAMGKFALRGLCQSLAKELAPQNIHVAHFVIDGLIHSPERGAPYDDASKCLNPDQMAETYWNIAQQDRNAWTWEIELRPWLEAF